MVSTVFQIPKVILHLFLFVLDRNVYHYLKWEAPMPLYCSWLKLFKKMQLSKPGAIIKIQQLLINIFVNEALLIIMLPTCTY